MAHLVPRSRMRVVSIGILWCCATVMSCLWTADLRAGPWQVVAPDGAIIIGTRWATPADTVVRGTATVLGLSMLVRGEPIPGGAIVTVRVPPAAGGSEVTLTVGSRTLSVRVVVPPAPGAPATVVVLGPGQALNAEGVGLIQAAAGERPTALLLVGGDRRERLEASAAHPWPALLVGTADDVAAMARHAPGGLHASLAVWGALGLPTAVDISEWPRAVARDLSPWTVPVLPVARWDPALFADPGLARATGCRDLIGLFAGLGHPVIIQVGSRTGFISEPLGLESTGIAVRSGGVRLIGATPLGDGIAGLDGHVAAACEAVGMTLVSADAEALTVSLLSATERLPITWRRRERPGGGWAGGDIDRAWTAAVADPPVVGDDLAWALPRAYDTLTPSSLQREALVAAADVDPLARIAVRRLLVRGDPIVVGEEPLWLRRERVLRDLGARSVHPGSPAFRELPTTSDLQLVHAAIRCADGRARGPILDALQRRLELQASGEVPLVADPLMQHRLVSAVFDASDRSPTPLRPLARALIDRLDPLSRGPVQRFLDQAGTYRTP